MFEGLTFMSRQLHIISIFHSTWGLTPDSQGKLDVWQFPGPLLQIFGFLIGLFQQLYLRGSHHHESVVSRYVFDLINLAQWRIHLSQIWFLLVVGEGVFWKNFSQLYRVFPKLQSLYVPHQKTKMEPPKMDRSKVTAIRFVTRWLAISFPSTDAAVCQWLSGKHHYGEHSNADMHEGTIDAPKYEVPVVVLPDKQWLDVSLIDGLLIVDVFLTHRFMLK